MSLRQLYRFGPFQLDPNERECRRGDVPVPLTGKAFDLLLLLVSQKPGRTIPKSELMSALWPDTAVEDGNLTQTVFLLRKALGDDSERAAYIHTVPRLGYKFTAPVTVIGPAAADGGKKRMRLLFALAAGVAITAAAAMLLKPGDASREKARKLTPFSFEAGRNENPVWSPDGKGVAFGVRRNETEEPRVYVRYLNSPTATQLTHGRDGGTPIAWTSAGRIVFHSSRPPEGLWTISPSGGEAEPLLPIVNFRNTSDINNARPSADVSPDGSVAAYYDADKDGVYGVMISSPAGSPARPYLPAPFAARLRLNEPKVKFSPDGKQILLVRRAEAGEETWLMPYPPDASNPPRRILRNLPPNVRTPAVSWMPDNRRIVLSISSESESRQLFLADTVSGEYSVLSSGTIPQTGPAVSPDGKRLIFQEVVSDQDLVSIRLANGEVRPLLVTNRREDMPAWAGNASAMVYVTDRNGQPEIWLHKPGESDRPLVTVRDFPPGTTEWFIGPVLSPDGSRVIYSRVESTGPGRLWISAVAGGAPVRVVTGDGIQDMTGSWSPDGSRFVFLRYHGGMADLYKVKTTGNAEPELLKAGVTRSGAWMPAWSPNGEWIVHPDAGVKLISPDGKTTRDTGSRNVLACGFSRDGARLYCLRQEQTSAPGVFFSLPVAGGPETVIGSFAPEYRPVPQLNPSIRLTLTPDGNSYTYSIHKSTSNLWLMDGIN